MPDPQQVKEGLAAAARELGFHGFGVAPASPLEDAFVAFSRWLDAGMMAGMDYMQTSRELRRGPEALLPGARSVVCVLVDYRELDDAAPPPSGVHGKVARYARSRDYHIVLRKRLKRLAADLEEAAPGSTTKVAVDSVPLMERAYAWRAGLGFLGKNTMLLTPGVGSYTLLGELLTDLELPPDEPGEGTCGRCTRCLDACPTGAFPEPGVLDARRCISCWTIEHKGPLPDDAALHGWAFGCDICQEVCPYNHEGDPPELGADFATPRAAGAFVSLAEVEALADRAAFAARYAGTPVMRAGREGLLRNLRRLKVENEEPA